MSEIVWACVNNGSFKVWGFDCFTNEKTGETNIITYFGRIGRTMQELRKINKWFKSYGDTYDYIMQKIKDKDCNYIRFSNPRYFELINSNKISTLIKEIEVKGK